MKALATFQLGHIDLSRGVVDQDARQVHTKFGKTFPTFFMPFCTGALEIVTRWVEELQQQHLWGPTDPLFPATEIGLGEDGSFQPIGIVRKGWRSSEPIRIIFHRAFDAAGLPYFNPHSMRDMLVHHVMSLDLSPEEMKALSQNLGHEDVLTTFTSYGKINSHRQGELIRSMIGERLQNARDRKIAELKALAAAL